MRSGNESVPASEDDLKRLSLRAGIKTFDSLPSECGGSELTFKSVRHRYVVLKGVSMPDGLLQSWGLEDGEGKLTNAGALLADDPPSCCPGICCTRWRGLAKGGLADAYEHQEYSGSLIWLLNSAVDILPSLKRGVSYRSLGRSSAGSSC